MTDVKIFTTCIIEGYTIVDYKGLVLARNVRAMNIIRDIGTAFRDFVGGRSGAYEEVMQQMQDETVVEICQKVAEKGGNAIVGFQLDFDNIGSKDKSLLMAFATGTAVEIQKISN